MKLYYWLRYKLNLYPKYWYGWTKPKDYGEFYEWAKQQGEVRLNSKGRTLK